MVPPVSDPRWTQYLDNLNRVLLKNLVTKLLSTRLRMMNWQQSEEKKQAAIAVAYEFFVKNEAGIADDMQLIFK